ncbi:hypothetical protein ABMA28_007341 [Loxostege sticticalis]|uniref:DUF659 domain-containing protein n=1 Tax=Loxostege sticticalis TaxID=481309 RepID=A0ABD0TQB8_LOXSC
MEYKFGQANRLKEHLVKCNNCPNDVKQLYKSENKRLKERVNVTSTPASPAPTSVSPSNLTPIPTITTPTPITPIVLPTHSTTTNSSNNSEFSFIESLPNSSTNTHEVADTALARAIYASGVPLSLLESEYWQAVFKIFDPSYTVPSRHLLSNHLLEAEYTRVKKEIECKLAKAVALGLTCDGWTNIVGKGVINFMITTPKPIFYNAIYPESEKEITLFLSEKIINTLLEIGPAKFVAVITDNDANMKAAWRLITAKFPHISCESFEKLQTDQYGKSAHSLKLFSKTRWSGAYVCLQSCKENRKALELLAISHEVNMSPELKNSILDHELWIKIEEIIKILQPVAIAILQTEKDNALLSDVPYVFSTLSSKLTQEFETADFLNEKDKTVILSTIEMRKNFCVQPIHYAAYQLDPRYCGESLNDEEIALVTEYLQHMSLRLDINVAKVLKNMAEFRLKENFFSESKGMWIPVRELEPRFWWRTFASQQDIATIAIRILSVPPSSAASSPKVRNRLNGVLAVKLLSIRSNLNLLRTNNEENVSLNISEEDMESEHTDNEVETEDPLLI